MTTRRVGLVGFGSIAEHSHLPAWLALPDVEVVAVADVSAQRRERAGTVLPGAELYTDPVELIEQARVDTVDICTPPANHAALLTLACGRGVANVICEKPLVLTEEEFGRVAEAREASGTRITSVNNWAHSDLNRHIKQVLETGTIGAIRRVQLRIGRPDCALGNTGWNPRWRTDASHAGGGIVLDHGWHQLYLLLGWMQQTPTAISATMRTVDPRHHPVEDDAHIRIFFSRAEARIDLSWTAQARVNEGRIEGDRGRITALDDRIVVESSSGTQELGFASPLSESSYHPDWFESVFRYNVVNHDRRDADESFAEAGLVVSAIRAAYRSAAHRGEPYPPAAVGGAWGTAQEKAESHGHSDGGRQTQ